MFCKKRRSLNNEWETPLLWKGLKEAISILEQSTEDARENRPVVIFGVSKAWATGCGSLRTIARGQALLQSLAALELVLLNSGTKPTFSKASTTSIIDLTFGSPGLDTESSWKVVKPIRVATMHQLSAQ